MGSIVYESGLIKQQLASQLSVVIITLNEEENLRRLLPEIPKGAEVILVDSGSSDRTVEVAIGFGAKVVVREFDNFSAQKNFAISLATRPWILSLDADERPDDELWQNIVLETSKESGQADCYSVSRRLVFLDRCMKYGRTKDELTRLFRAKTATYKNSIHETLILKSNHPPKKLGGILWHHSYLDLNDYFNRFNRYTSLMAQSRLNAGIKPPPRIVLAFRIPVDFFVRYVLKLGWLDGWHGFLWALFGSFYGFVKYAKLIEQRIDGQNKT